MVEINREFLRKTVAKISGTDGLLRLQDELLLLLLNSGGLYESTLQVLCSLVSYRDVIFLPAEIGAQPSTFQAT